jgi:hypothetical protein
LSAADIRFIQDVVMEEGGGVNELNETAKQEEVLLDIPVHPGSKDKQERPNAFASAIENMPGDGVNERGMGMQMFVNLNFDLIEVRPEGIPHILH